MPMSAVASVAASVLGLGAAGATPAHEAPATDSVVSMPRSPGGVTGAPARPREGSAPSVRRALDARRPVAWTRVRARSPARYSARASVRAARRADAGRSAVLTLVARSRSGENATAWTATVRLGTSSRRLRVVSDRVPAGYSVEAYVTSARGNAPEVTALTIARAARGARAGRPGGVSAAVPSRAWAPIAPTARASAALVPFRADYETGDLSQWNEAEGRVSVVSAPRRSGRFAGRFEVRPGDKPSSSGERAEVAAHYLGHEREGESYYYSFSMLLPPGWVQQMPGWRIPLQFHSVDVDLAGRTPAPALALDFLPRAGLPNGTGRGGLFLELHGGDVTRTRYGTATRVELLPRPVRTGVWHDFVLYVHWHRERGSVRVWHRTADQPRFVLRAEVEARPNLFFIRTPSVRVARNFMRQGLYRRDNRRGQTSVIYLDATTRGLGFEEAVRAFG